MQQLTIIFSLLSLSLIDSVHLLTYNLSLSFKDKNEDTSITELANILYYFYYFSKSFEGAVL